MSLLTQCSLNARNDESDASGCGSSVSLRWQKMLSTVANGAFPPAGVIEPPSVKESLPAPLLAALFCAAAALRRERPWRIAFMFPFVFSTFPLPS